MNYAKTLYFFYRVFPDLSSLALASILIEPLTAYNFVFDSSVRATATTPPQEATIKTTSCNGRARTLVRLVRLPGNTTPTWLNGLPNQARPEEIGYRTVPA